MANSLSIRDANSASVRARTPTRTLRSVTPRAKRLTRPPKPLGRLLMLGSQAKLRISARLMKYLPSSSHSASPWWFSYFI